MTKYTNTQKETKEAMLFTIGRFSSELTSEQQADSQTKIYPCILSPFQEKKKKKKILEEMTIACYLLAAMNGGEWCVLCVTVAYGRILVTHYSRDPTAIYSSEYTVL